MDGMDPDAILDDLETRIADLAAFMDIDVDEATAMLQAWLTDEAEPINAIYVRLN